MHRNAKYNNRLRSSGSNILKYQYTLPLNQNKADSQPPNQLRTALSNSAEIN